VVATRQEKPQSGRVGRRNPSTIGYHDRELYLLRRVLRAVVATAYIATLVFAPSAPAAFAAPDAPSAQQSGPSNTAPVSQPIATSDIAKSPTSVNPVPTPSASASVNSNATAFSQSNTATTDPTGRYPGFAAVVTSSATTIPAPTNSAGTSSAIPQGVPNPVRTPTATAIATSVPTSMLPQSGATIPGLRPVPFVDQSGDSNRDRQYRAQSGGVLVEAFDKIAGSADVRLTHTKSGTQLGFLLDGSVVHRAVSEARASAELGGVLLVWTSFTDRLKEDLVVNAPLTTNTIRFRVEQRGLHFAPDGHGGYLARDRHEVARFHILPPTVHDALGQVGTITLQLDEHVAVVSLDPTFAERATYPLTIDPTVTFNGAAVQPGTPANAAGGSSVTVTWDGITSPTPTDWIGVYQAGAPDQPRSAWQYVNCSQASTVAVAAGSCPFSLPSALGQYEIRLYSNDGYTPLAVSDPIEVTSNGGNVISDPRVICNGVTSYNPNWCTTQRDGSFATIYPGGSGMYTNDWRLPAGDHFHLTQIIVGDTGLDCLPGGCPMTVTVFGQNPENPVPTQLGQETRYSSSTQRWVFNVDPSNSYQTIRIQYQTQSWQAPGEVQLIGTIQQGNPILSGNVINDPRVICDGVTSYNSNWCAAQRDGSFATIYPGGQGTYINDWRLPAGDHFHLTQIAIGDTGLDCLPGGCPMTVTVFGQNPENPAATQLAQETRMTSYGQRWVFNVDPNTPYQTIRIQYQTQSWQAPGEVQLIGTIQQANPILSGNVIDDPRVGCSGISNYNGDWCSRQRDGSMATIYPGGNGSYTNDWTLPPGDQFQLNQIIVGDTGLDCEPGGCNMTLTVYGQNPNNPQPTPLAQVTRTTTYGQRWVLSIDPTAQYQTIRIQFQTTSWQVPGEVQLIGAIQQGNPILAGNVTNDSRVGCGPGAGYDSSWCTNQRDGSLTPIYPGRAGAYTNDWTLPAGDYFELSQIEVGDTGLDCLTGGCPMTVTIFGQNPSDLSPTQLAQETRTTAYNQRWVFNVDPSAAQFQTIRVQYQTSSWQVPGEVQLIGNVFIANGPYTTDPDGLDGAFDDDQDPSVWWQVAATAIQAIRDAPPPDCPSALVQAWEDWKKAPYVVTRCLPQWSARPVLYTATGDALVGPPILLPPGSTEFAANHPVGSDAAGSAPIRRVNVQQEATSVSRRAAFRLAKDKGGIVRTSQPYRVDHVTLYDQVGYIESREYYFARGDGKTVIIREHSLGHPEYNQTPHFNTEVFNADGTKAALVNGADSHTLFNPFFDPR
jgi:hypothetical protein